MALTSILCKTLEHIVASNLHKHLDKHGWLAHYQHGFRRKRSCETQLLITTTDFYRTMETGGITDAIVLDFSKAFDKVPHEFLMCASFSILVSMATSAGGWNTSWWDALSA